MPPVLSLLLTIFGILIMWKLSRKMKGWLTILVDIIGIILIGFGVYSLWRQAPLLILGVVVFVGVLLMYSYYQNRPDVKAKKIFKIYKQTKADHSEASEQEVYRKTAKQYYKSATDWVKVRVDMTAGTVAGFGRESMDKPKNAKELAENIIMFEESGFRSGNFTSPHEVEKRKEAIESVYKSMN